MNSTTRNRVIVGLLTLTNVFALLHYAHQFNVFHTAQSFFACAGLLAFLALQGFFLVKQSKLVISAILLASVVSFGLHIGWRVFDGSALGSLFLNLEYAIQPGSILGLVGIGDHESFLVMLEPVVLYSFVFISVLGLLPQAMHDFTNALPTSPTGEYVHNPKVDRNGKVIREDNYNRHEHLYHIFASTPAKSLRYKAMGFTYIACFAFLMFMPADHFWDMPGGLLASGLLAVVLYFLIFKFAFRKDSRIKAHDTWVYFNTSHLVAPSNIKTDENLDVAMDDIKNFCIRPTTREDGSMVKAQYAPSSAMGSALLAGGASEYFFGTSVMPGSVGLATGAFAGGATALANTASGAMVGLFNGMRRAHLEHKLKIAEHSFVLELEMKDGTIHTIAGGLNEEIATKLMKEIAKHCNEDHKAFWADVDQRTKEQIALHGAPSLT